LELRRPEVVVVPQVALRIVGGASEALVVVVRLHRIIVWALGSPARRDLLVEEVVKRMVARVVEVEQVALEALAATAMGAALVMEPLIGVVLVV
jgi:hypothetical protein